MRRSTRGEDETARRVRRAQAGEAESFDWLVRRFQDRAVAYAASVLGDLSLAEDAAQAAFVDAFLRLPLLRAPEAFPAWLRTILLKHCDRLRRGLRPDTLPLASAHGVAASGEGPEQAAERRELERLVGEAVNALPEGERQAVRLFYMGRHSHREVAEFLGVPATTVKSRLHEARRRLRETLISEGMVTMVEDTLHEGRPSRDDEFLARVNGDIAELLGSVGPEQEIEVRPGTDNPLFELVASVLARAIAVGVTDILLVPEADRVSVRFTRGGQARQVAALPKRLQRPLLDRLKMCADVDRSLRDASQDGKIPILHEGVRFDAFASFRPSGEGESVGLHLIRL